MPEVNLDAVANLSPELQRAYVAAVKGENKPIKAIEERKSFMESRMKLLDDVIGRVENVRSLLPNLDSPIAIRDLAFASGDDKIITGSADKSEAEPGKHALEVLQLARGAGALSNRFADSENTKIGSGFFSFTNRNGDSEDIFIDNENSSLKGIARIINTSDLGLRASVIRDDADPELPYRLLLTTQATGQQEAVEYPEFYFVDGDEDFYVEEERGPANAKVRYEGFDVESPTNQLKDLIRGVTLDLKGVTQEGRPLTVTIEQDLPKTTVKMKDLVEGLNRVFSFIQQQNNLDEKSDTRGTLGGDYAIRHTEDRIKTAMQENFFGVEGRAVQSLYDIGIQIDRHGLIKFDEKKFQHNLETNYDQVVELLAGDGTNFGFIPRLGRTLSSVVGKGTGLLTGQKQTYVTQMDKVNSDLAAKNKRSEDRMEELRSKLARANAAIAQIRNQQGQLQQAGGAPGMPG